MTNSFYIILHIYRVIHDRYNLEFIQIFLLMCIHNSHKKNISTFAVVQRIIRGITYLGKQVYHFAFNAEIRENRQCV